MNIQALIDKYRIDMTDSFPGLPEIKEPWEAFAVNTYIQQKRRFDGIAKGVAEGLEKEGPDSVHHIYGKCFEPPFGVSARPVSSDSEADKLKAIEAAMARLPQIPGIMLDTIDFTEEKHGLFAKKTYICTLTYRKEVFEGIEKVSAKMAAAFRYSARPDVDKELLYLNLADASDLQVLLQLSENCNLPRSKNEEYRKKAIEQLERKVAAGDTSVMGLYARLILTESPKAAKRFAQMAAEEGDAWGYYVLGKMLEDGIDTETDMEKAIEYYEKASQKGNADALYALGKWHQRSNRSEKAKVRAFNFFKAAADQGHGPALYELGLALENGTGTRRDPNNALHCFKAAADLKITDGIFMLGMAYYNGAGTVKKVNEAFRYLKQAADLGQPQAQLQVAKMYAEGIEGSSDWGKAFAYFIKAANSGDAEAQYWSGVYYDDGRGVAKDKAMAASYYMEAADQGNQRAIRKMSEMFMSHAGSEDTRRDAFDYLKQIAENGNPIALSQLGRAYWIGNGTEINHEIAFKYYKQAADKDYREAQYRVGMCLKNGDGAKKNLTQALGYFKLAAAQGHGQSTVEAQSVARMLKALQDENSLSAELTLLSEAEDYEQIFRLLGEYGISMSDEKLMKDIFCGFVENAIDNQEGGVNTKTALFEFLVKMAEKGLELKAIAAGENIYDAALQFEEEERMLHALTAYVLSAMAGCKKAAATLNNMANEGSRYFISLDKTYL